LESYLPRPGEERKSYFSCLVIAPKSLFTGTSCSRRDNIMGCLIAVVFVTGYTVYRILKSFLLLRLLIVYNYTGNATKLVLQLV
jgi:hypothetical protein